MKIDLRELNGFVPDLDYGNAGNELSCFIPDGFEWKQVNYGQGEGQVMINGCEWGFYYGDNDVVSVVLHSGKVPLQETLSFINGVVCKIYGSKADSVSVNVTGADE